jgi:S-DNA-T family DNA segregation ATPase FtsK/SpoIIIE
MAVKQSTKEKNVTGRAPRTPRPPKLTRAPRRNERFGHDLGGVGLIAVGLVTLIGLIYSGSGQIGHALAVFCHVLFGVGAYLIPPLLVYSGVVLIVGKNPASRAELIGGMLCLALDLLAWWHFGHTTRADQLDKNSIMAYGGYVGWAICAVVRFLFGIGGPIIFTAGGIASIVVLSDMRLLHLIKIPIDRSAKTIGYFKERSERKHSDMVDDDEVEQPVAQIRKRVQSSKSEVTFSKGRVTDDDMPTVAVVPRPMPDMPVPVNVPVKQLPLNLDRLGETVDSHNKNYQLPPVSLLLPPPPPPKQSESSVTENKNILMQTLNDFKVGANVREVAVGPTVTRYEVMLEPGILVKKIVSLADNLAMSLAAIDVRVEAPIPGKSAIGIEVPNDVVQLVSMRECLETQEFINSPSKLTFALGKDVAGEYKYADLARMPHLLIGGSTNSGKSVCLNALITSILFRATPREVRFVMIDPKRVELTLYDGIPHLLSPVIKDTKQAAGIFRSVLKEMESRYDAFNRVGTRNIAGYNEKVEPRERLPYIVVVVDELADLMMTHGPDVETSICRLAQLARATGIHLVLATQRPSVDVITGIIKANIGSRIAFAVATQVDSRTILDTPGADRLIGRGDMLFLPMDASKPLRVQGCYIGEKETAEVVSYLKSQEEPKYTMLPADGPSGTGGNGKADWEEEDDNDELFEPCVRWLVMQKTASTSSLQRKFKVGYTRAARMIETMEAKGIVGSQDGVKPREVLLQADQVEAYFSGFQNGDLGQV